ncbi:MAG: HPF/RaiA family ribosome-associated protein [Gemmataceae bacterium]
MHVEIRHQGVELNEDTRTRLYKRLDFALGRVASRVARVWAHVHDRTESGGELMKRCRILVRLSNRPDVVVEDRSADLNTAIDRAINRAGMAVRRELDRGHSHR